MRQSVRFSIPLLVLWSLPTATLAQSTLTQPPSGGNQKASVIQHVGPVQVRIDYSSPDVTGPNGEDRRGKIWGGLVPWGMANLGFGTAPESPWRAGANENTVFTVSHDVLVEGEPLAAGSYGLHMAPQENEWTVIFSHNSTSWGSFFYDPSEDALRVQVKPEKAPFREWLTYDFVDRQPAETTLALHWEELRVPIRVSVPNLTELYADSMRNELRSSPGFAWQSWVAGANYLIQNNIRLEEALEWAEHALSAPFVGQENFTTLQTKALVLTKLGRGAEADPVLARLLETGTENEVNNLGYAFLGNLQDPDRAIEVFAENLRRHPESWNCHDSLAEGHLRKGDRERAKEHYSHALAMAPQAQKARIEGILATL
jgi:hypothetical protein